MIISCSSSSTTSPPTRSNSSTRRSSPSTTWQPTFHAASSPRSWRASENGMPASLSFLKFQQDLKTGNIAPVYLLEGEEAYFHDEAIRLLEKSAVPEGARAMNREAVRGGEISLIALLDLARTYPMGSGRRLIVVRDADALRAAAPDPLKAYLTTPNPRACLVFSDVKFDR